MRGLDPMGVPERRADLEDAETGELIRVPIAELPRPGFVLLGGGYTGAGGPVDARDGHLRRQLRHGRQAADRAAEDGRRQPLPPDLDRASRGGGDPRQAAERRAGAADDPRPAERRRRPARRRGDLGRRHRDAREHLLRADHPAAERLRDRGRLAALRRDRARRSLRREDLRRGRGDRGVRGRVRGRRLRRGDRGRAPACRRSPTSTRTSSAPSSTRSPRTSSRPTRTTASLSRRGRSRASSGRAARCRSRAGPRP